MSAHAATKPRRSRLRPDAPDATSRIVGLLASYPNVSASEANEILRYIKGAKYIEIESLRSDAAIKRQLDIFIKSHSHELAFSAAELVCIIGLIVAFLAVSWLLWQAV